MEGNNERMEGKKDGNDERKEGRERKGPRSPSQVAWGSRIVVREVALEGRKNGRKERRKEGRKEQGRKDT